jgi:integrase/recombinase XerD
MGRPAVTLVAPTLQAFFTERLWAQRQSSPKTVSAYRDSFALLLRFVSERTSTSPSRLDFAHLDAPAIGAFLQHLEADRHNSTRTRNARLAAIRSFFRFAALRHPEHAGSIERVLAIPQKRCVRNVVSFLTRAEAAALLSSADRSSWTGRRDHALMLLALHAGLRVGELVGLCCQDVALGAGAHVRCRGKGRKERCTPLSREAVAVLRNWLAERAGRPEEPLFPTRRGTPLSADAVQAFVAKYAIAASAQCPSLAAKHVTPHVLRHSNAMFLRERGVDLSTIALWLGHEQLATVQVYLHADLAIKEAALERAAPPGSKPGRYRPADPLLAFLESL